MNEDITTHPIFKEVYEAYYDCGHLYEITDGKGSEEFYEIAETTMEVRNLRFRASQAVNRDTAIAIMEKACPGYNNFEPSLLKFLPDDCEITLAREGSVCIYVRKGRKRLPKKKLMANEYDLMEKTTFGDQWHSPSNDPTNKYGPKTNYGGFEGEVRIWWD